MTVHLTLASTSEQVVDLVGDFARGLGCGLQRIPVGTGQGVRIEVPDLGHSLVELLAHVALSATKAGVDVAEPLCRVTYRHPGVSSSVTVTLRVADVSIDSAAPVSA